MDQISNLTHFIESNSASILLNKSTIKRFEAVVGVPCFGNKPTSERSIGSLMSSLNRDSMLIVSLENYSIEDAKSLCEALLVHLSTVKEPVSLLVIHHGAVLKLINHWNFLIDCALLIPECKYFAWGSDHDIWDQDWYAETRAIFESNPSCLLAVPQIAIQPHNKKPQLLKVKTTLSNRQNKIEKALGQYGPGNTVYGLFSMKVFRLGLRLNHVLLPDRLMLTLIALWTPVTYGNFEGKPFWTRVELNSRTRVLAKQRKTVLLGKFNRLVSYAPWTLVHALVAVRFIPRISRMSQTPKHKLLLQLLAFEFKSEFAHRRKQFRYLKHRMLKIEKMNLNDVSRSLK